jgi:hypothetical protein
MKVNGKDDIPYMNWKIKFMFETTNQIISVLLSWNFPHRWSIPSPYIHHIFTIRMLKMPWEKYLGTLAGLW